MCEKTALSSILIVLLCAVPAAAGENRWTALGPDLALTRDLVVDATSPNVLYVTTTATAGIFRSTDAGRNWVWVGEDLPPQLAFALAQAPGTGALWLGFLGHGLFRSTDGGETWQARDTGLEDLDIRDIVVAPSNASVLFVATDAGVFRSLDDGASWSARNTGLGSLDVERIAVDPVDAERLIVVVDDLGAFLSADGGGSWTAADASLTASTVADVAIAPSDAQRAAVAGGVAGVFRSDDGGATWAPTTADVPGFVSLVAFHPQDADRMFAGTGGGLLWRSADGGETWESAPIHPARTGIQAIVPGPTALNRVLASDNAGVALSTDGGATWQERSGGLRVSRIESVEVDPVTSTTLYAATDHASLYKSTDRGASWSFAGAGLPERLLFSALAASAPQELYVGNGVGLYRSLDGAASWEEVTGTLTGSIRAVAVDPSDATTVYAGTSDGVFRSSDRGATWTLSNTGLVAGAVPARLVVHPADTSVLYLATRDQGAFRSDDGGVTWTDISDGLGQLTIRDLAVDPTSAGTLIVATQSAVFRSTDAGASWTQLHGSSRGIAVDPGRPEVFYAARSAGAFRGSTTPESWQPLGRDPVTPIREAILQDVVVDPTDSARLYTWSSNGGVYERTIVPGLLFDPEGGLEVDESGATTTTTLRLATAPTAPVTVPVAVSDATELASDTTELVFLPQDALVARTVEVSGLDDAAPDGDQTVELRAGPAQSADTDYAGLAAAVDVVNRDDETASDACVPDETTLCIDRVPGDRRFRVTMSFETVLGGGNAGQAKVFPLSAVDIDRGGILYFFERENPEVLIKILDGCGLTQHFWVFFAATTTIGYELTVEDTVASVSKTYRNPDQNPAAPVTDTSALAGCSE